MFPSIFRYYRHTDGNLYPITDSYACSEDNKKDFSYIARCNGRYTRFEIASRRMSADYRYIILQPPEFTVDWGDGTETVVDNSWGADYVGHVYDYSGDYTVTVKNYVSGYISLLSNSNVIKILTPLPPQRGRTDFYQAFHNCDQLESIPSDLFVNCPDAEDFTECFFMNTSLTRLPPRLFANCPNALSFYQCFGGCRKLKAIGKDVFKGCTKAIDFSRAFVSDSLLEEIPDGLFDDCISAETFYMTFAFNTGLKRMPYNPFDKCIKAYDFYMCFSDDTALTGIAPALWERTTSGLRGNVCFGNCTGLSNYDEIPTGWK